MLGRIGVGWRETVGYGSEVEVEESGEGVGPRDLRRRLWL